MKAIQITKFGGPEVLELIELADPTPGENEELIDVSCIGINYADTHQTENSYLSKQELPLIPGLEVVGKTQSGRRVLQFELVLMIVSMRHRLSSSHYRMGIRQILLFRDQLGIYDLELVWGRQTVLQDVCILHFDCR